MKNQDPVPTTRTAGGRTQYEYSSAIYQNSQTSLPSSTSPPSVPETVPVLDVAKADDVVVTLTATYLVIAELAVAAAAPEVALEAGFEDTEVDGEDADDAALELE